MILVFLISVVSVLLSYWMRNRRHIAISPLLCQLCSFAMLISTMEMTDRGQGELYNCLRCLFGAYFVVFNCHHRIPLRLRRRLTSLANAWLEYSTVEWLEMATGLEIIDFNLHFCYADSRNVAAQADDVRRLLSDPKHTSLPAWQQPRRCVLTSSSTSTASTTAMAASSSSRQLLSLPNEMLTAIARATPTAIDRNALMSTCHSLRRVVIRARDLWPDNLEICLTYRALYSDNGITYGTVLSDIGYYVNRMHFKSIDKVESAAKYLLKYGNIQTITVSWWQFCYPLFMKFEQRKQLFRIWRAAEVEVIRRISGLLSETNDPPEILTLRLGTYFKPNYGDIAQLVRRLSGTLRHVHVAKSNEFLGVADEHELMGCASLMIDALGECKQLETIQLATKQHSHTVSEERFLAAFAALPRLTSFCMNPELLPSVTALGHLLSASNGSIDTVCLCNYWPWEQGLVAQLQHGEYPMGSLGELINGAFDERARANIIRMCCIYEPFAADTDIDRLAELLPNCRQLLFYQFDTMPTVEQEMRRWDRLCDSFLTLHRHAADSQRLRVDVGYDEGDHTGVFQNNLSRTNTQGNASVNIQYTNQPICHLNCNPATGL